MIYTHPHRAYLYQGIVGDRRLSLDYAFDGSRYCTPILARKAVANYLLCVCVQFIFNSAHLVPLMRMAPSGSVPCDMKGTSRFRVGNAAHYVLSHKSFDSSPPHDMDR